MLGDFRDGFGGHDAASVQVERASMDHHAGAGFVKQIKGLVGLAAINHKFAGKRHSSLQRFRGNLDAVMLAVVALDIGQDGQRIFGRWFLNRNCAEAAKECDRNLDT